MPSRSEGWGGLFKDEQYRLNQTAGGEPRPGRVWMILAVVINRYCSSLNRPPRLRCAKAPRLTQAGNGGCFNNSRLLLFLGWGRRAVSDGIQQLEHLTVRIAQKKAHSRLLPDIEKGLDVTQKTLLVSLHIGFGLVVFSNRPFDFFVAAVGTLTQPAKLFERV